MADGLMLVTRLPEPAWVSQPHDDEAARALECALGEDPRWGYGIPGLFRVLAAPRSFEPIPAAPEGTGSLSEGHAYWTTLLHMLVYSLGWARPDRGLRWWYDSGCPTGDPRLTLLDQVWRRDGYLEDFAVWMSHSTWALPLQLLHEVTGYRADGDTVAVHPAWIAGSARGDSLFAGGSDPYHLSVHSAGPLVERDNDGVLLRSSETRRRAVLVLDSMIGWYRALHNHGAVLPPLGDRSWHVDVVVRPTGWLGTYRRSRATGLWFSGPHRYHTPGT